MAISTNVYHVAPAFQGWSVLAEDGNGTSAYAEKSTALRYGQELARASRGHLVIHREDGSIQAEHKY